MDDSVRAAPFFRSDRLHHDVTPPSKLQIFERQLLMSRWDGAFPQQSQVDPNNYHFFMAGRPFILDLEDNACNSHLFRNDPSPATEDPLCDDIVFLPVNFSHCAIDVLARALRNLAETHLSTWEQRVGGCTVSSREMSRNIGIDHLVKSAYFKCKWCCSKFKPKIKNVIAADESSRMHVISCLLCAKPNTGIFSTRPDYVGCYEISTYRELKLRSELQMRLLHAHRVLHLRRLANLAVVFHHLPVYIILELFLLVAHAEEQTCCTQENEKLLVTHIQRALDNTRLVYIAKEMRQSSPKLTQ